MCCVGVGRYVLCCVGSVGVCCVGDFCSLCSSTGGYGPTVTSNQWVLRVLNRHFIVCNCS